MMIMWAPLLWLPLLATGLFYITQNRSRKRRMQGASFPPGPKGWPFVGNALELASSNSQTMIETFRRWTEAYGSVVQFTLMGGDKQVIVSDHKIANELFVNRGSKYSDRGAAHAVEYITMKQNPGFRPKDEGWRRQRNMIHGAISITSINKYQSLMDNEATFTLLELTQSPSSFNDQFLRYSYSVLTTSLLGFPVRSTSDPYMHHNEEFTAEIMKGFRPDCFPSNVFPILRALPYWLVPSLRKMESLRREYEEQMWRFRREIERLVKEGKATESVYKNFLLNRSEYSVTDEESVHTFQALLDGGTRSPHNNLLTFLFLMMDYPEWQRKLQEEVDSVCGEHRMPNYTDIPQLPTVRAVVKEGVRYRSIVAEMSVSHALQADDIYNGFYFEKGTVFHAPFRSILMDKEEYPDGELFNPARWLEPGYPTYREPLTVYPNCRKFAAFGYGRRACPGVEFAERTLVIMAAKLAWAVNIRWPLDQDGNELREEIEYEPVPAPRPMNFGCSITARTPERVEVIKQAAGELDLFNQTVSDKH
ncbi:putative cytochrome P450 oxidoreductase [Colletotrichum cereale]|nr:putative cytochrome P450 oxidoreductase [Colletotrichum cereale]